MTEFIRDFLDSLPVPKCKEHGQKVYVCSNYHFHHVRRSDQCTSDKFLVTTNEERIVEKTRQQVIEVCLLWSSTFN